jgi:hypothetical protein
MMRLCHDFVFSASGKIEAHRYFRVKRCDPCAFLRA